MTNIDFHILASGGIDALLHHCCRVIEKGWRANHSMYIHTNNKVAADKLDELLWGFRADAFIPHQQQDQDKSNIIIGHGDDPGLDHDIMINLDQQKTPNFFSRFERVFEIVGNDVGHKENAREKWRYYQHRGYPLQKHDIR